MSDRYIRFIPVDPNYVADARTLERARKHVAMLVDAGMDVASKTGFAQVTVTVPCCRSMISLNDLDYDFPAGFARTILEALNPNTSDIDAAATAVLESILGTPVRRVRAR